MKISLDIMLYKAEKIAKIAYAKSTYFISSKIKLINKINKDIR
jgi:hypothetical protein